MPGTRYDGCTMVRTVQIEVTEETLAAVRRDPEEYAAELRLAGAAKLYELGKVSQEVAAEIAGLGRTEFLQALAHFEVSPFQDTRQSLKDELARD